MRSRTPLGVLGLILAVSSADAATITGTVKGPDGQPFRGAFVQARNAQLKMTVSVLTDKEGRYVVENLPAGDYRVGIRAVGYSSAAKSGLKLTADQNLPSQDFALATREILGDGERRRGFTFAGAGAGYEQYLGRPILSAEAKRGDDCRIGL